MKTFCSLLLALAAGTVLAADAAPKKSQDPSAALERFKKLAGDWEGKGSHEGQEHDVSASYKVTSAGTAVVETIAPGTEHEMITVIHVDGDALALTHYCALGNQPHMEARPLEGEDSVAFDFISASNLKSEQDMYMHDVMFTFVDDDTLKVEWTHFDGGKEAGKARFEMHRKK